MVRDHADGSAAVQETTSTDDSVAASGDLVKSRPRHSRVLDCACGTGQLAVGLTSLCLDVVATDASLGMVRRTFNPETEGHVVVAGREWALVTSEPQAGVDTHIGSSDKPLPGPATTQPRTVLPAAS